MKPNELETTAGPVPIVQLRGVRLRYGRVKALDGVDLDLPGGQMVGLIGPDGVGKSSLLALLAGTRRIQEGAVQVLGGDMADARHRQRVCPRIAYMPQGLGRNLYPTLSVHENLDFFSRLFGQVAEERELRMASLLRSTGLAPFADRPVGQLSGGMKQKLGLCCALIHSPDLLILDEPTTGVDPLSRRQFWDLIDRIRSGHPGMGVVVATSYMDEAARFDWLVAMDAGRILMTGSPSELLKQTDTTSLDAAFIALLPSDQRRGHREVRIPPRPADSGEVAIEARGLTRRFGDFVAVDRVDFRIERGEIFGFLGSNGCGKTTTMKMLTGLLPASGGEARLFGRPVDAEDIATRRRVGYMSQSFSLYSELTVRQNLALHARLFRVPAAELPGRVQEMLDRFELSDAADALPGSLPLGVRQRLSLAVALIHRPDLLILDEPTSGVDPVARDGFWRLLVDLSRKDRVTIFISTHFVNEAARCDRLSLMHAGRVLVSDIPAALVQHRGVATLEDAFIGYLEDAEAGERSGARDGSDLAGIPAMAPTVGAYPERAFHWGRMLSYSRREALELSRDPIRLTLAVLGSVLLMFIMGYGISLDVDDLPFAVLDRDETVLSRDYALNLSGSRYFARRVPLTSHQDLDRRMKSGELSVALEIPPGFARDVEHGRPVEIGVWVDGAMPTRAETVLGYVQGMHSQWTGERLRQQKTAVSPPSPMRLETRFRYNPDVRSLVAMVPAEIPLLLMLIPAMLAALSVVREKELGSIINFQATPTTPVEFLMGKQLPYVVVAVLNYLLLTFLAVVVLDVPLTGSFPAQAFGALLYVVASTAFGLWISSFVRSQVAAIFGTAILTILPAVSFSGMLVPVSSLDGLPAWVGRLYPTTHFLDLSRGTFSKALGFGDLTGSLLPLLLAAPLLLVVAVASLRKQEH